MIKKICALTLTIALSLSVYAAGFENKVSPSIEYGSLINVTTFENLNGQVNVGIQFLSEECREFSSQPFPVPSMEINGTLVKQYGQCVSNGLRMDFPATYEGTEYVRKQFLNNAKVAYKQGDFTVTFDTKNYAKAVKEAKGASSGI